MTEYAFLFQNGILSWDRKKQATACSENPFALSTTEAEYMSLSAATQESVWLKDLLAEI